MIGAIAFVVFVAVISTNASADLPAEIVTLSVNIGASEAVYVDHEARYVAAEGPHAVVLAHQSGEDMESWSDLQQALGERGIASIATAEVRGGDVAAAIGFLLEKGYSNIVPIGASMGGGAVLTAMSGAALPGVSRVILMATASGPPLDREGVASLHIIGAMDFYAGTAYSAHELAIEPKSMIELETNAHAQALFETEFKDQVIAAIVSFVTQAR